MAAMQIRDYGGPDQGGMSVDSAKWLDSLYSLKAEHTRFVKDPLWAGYKRGVKHDMENFVPNKYRDGAGIDQDEQDNRKNRF